MFSDADCPFCARLEEELKNVDNVTIYTFLYPIDQLHPDAARKSQADLVRAGQVKAWDEFFVNGALPDNTGDCDNPVAATRGARPEAARQRRRRRWCSPTARSCPGALPARTLETELQRGRGAKREEASAAAAEEVAASPRAREPIHATLESEDAMAIIDFLKKQFIDIIEWTDDSRDTLSWRFPDEDKEIKNGAQLIVRESQVAQFVYLGQFGDTLRPGQAHADDRQHPDPHQPQELEVRAREPVQGRRLLRRHARCSPATSGARRIR